MSTHKAPNPTNRPNGTKPRVVSIPKTPPAKDPHAAGSNPKIPVKHSQDDLRDRARKNAADITKAGEK